MGGKTYMVEYNEFEENPVRIMVGLKGMPISIVLISEKKLTGRQKITLLAFLRKNIDIEGLRYKFREYARDIDLERYKSAIKATNNLWMEMAKSRDFSMKRAE